MSGAEATEERLLSELLASNEELLDALQLYDQLERIGVEQRERESREAERKVNFQVTLPCCVAIK